MKISTIVVAAFFAAFLPFTFAQQKPVAAQYVGWQQAGAMCILTTPDGANLPAGTSVEGFPVLVRLNKEWFDFSKAKSNGDDIPMN